VNKSAKLEEWELYTKTCAPVSGRVPFLALKQYVVGERFEP